MKTGELSSYEAYKTVLDTRNFEINLFWQRSNYFLVLTTALAVGFFNVSNKGYSLLLAVLGLIISGLWYGVNLGGKFWQSRWEHRLKLVEKEIAPDLDFFAADRQTLLWDVQENLKAGNYKGVQKLLYGRIFKKPSVSYRMILLSVVFVLAWIVLLVIQILKFLRVF